MADRILVDCAALARYKLTYLGIYIFMTVMQCSCVQINTISNGLTRVY